MRFLSFLLSVFTASLAAQNLGTPPRTLPALASAQLAKSLAASEPQKSNVWRDTSPTNADGTINGYVEIPMGDRQKFEFDIRSNARSGDNFFSRASRSCSDSPSTYSITRNGKVPSITP